MIITFHTRSYVISQPTDTTALVACRTTICERSSPSPVRATSLSASSRGASWHRLDVDSELNARQAALDGRQVVVSDRLALRI